MFQCLFEFISKTTTMISVYVRIGVVYLRSFIKYTLRTNKELTVLRIDTTKDCRRSVPLTSKVYF